METLLNTTTKFYIKAMFTYGILSVLYALEKFEKEERYEECQKIIEAIKLQEKRLDTKLFTTITTENIAEVIEGYKKFGMTGENAVENSKCYSEIIYLSAKSQKIIAK
jgi:hypothetical protein